MNRTSVFPRERAKGLVIFCWPVSFSLEKRWVISFSWLPLPFYLLVA
jgi:hypothetical protein